MFDAAQAYIEKDFLLRYICHKYTMPPTDPRVQAYTMEELLIEYVADGIEKDTIIRGLGGRPIKKVLYKGEEIYQTGNPMFDAMEREWVDQDLSGLTGPKTKQVEPAEDGNVEPHPTDLLHMIENKVKNGG